MDTVGDAEAIGYDEATFVLRARLATPEALAVTSIATAMGSFFVATVSQYVVALLAGPFHLGGGRKQITLVLLPVAALSFVAVCSGVVAVKRRSADRWVSALAIAGAVVGALVLLLVVTAILVSWVSNPGGNNND
jgi:hypothetical protein